MSGMRKLLGGALICHMVVSELAAHENKWTGFQCGVS